jgi:hypothetical protein
MKEPILEDHGFQINKGAGMKAGLSEVILSFKKPKVEDQHEWKTSHLFSQ